MNLHALAAPAVHRVNPFIPATLLRSTGYTVSDDGHQVPTYAPPIAARVQVQMLAGKDLAQLDNITLQGTVRAVYLSGDWEGMQRPLQKGGDLLQFDGQTWLVIAVLEHWADWSKLAVSLQVPA